MNADTQRCPSCSQTISAGAGECRYCGTRLQESPSPLASGSIQREPKTPGTGRPLAAAPRPSTAKPRSGGQKWKQPTLGKKTTAEGRRPRKRIGIAQLLLPVVALALLGGWYWVFVERDKGIDDRTSKGPAVDSRDVIGSRTDEVNSEPDSRPFDREPHSGIVDEEALSCSELRAKAGQLRRWEASLKEREARLPQGTTTKGPPGRPSSPRLKPPAELPFTDRVGTGVKDPDLPTDRGTALDPVESPVAPDDGDLVATADLLEYDDDACAEAGTFSQCICHSACLSSLRKVLTRAEEDPGNKRCGRGVTVGRTAYNNCVTSDCGEFKLTKEAWEVGLKRIATACGSEGGTDKWGAECDRLAQELRSAGVNGGHSCSEFAAYLDSAKEVCNKAGRRDALSSYEAQYQRTCGDAAISDREETIEVVPAAPPPPSSNCDECKDAVNHVIVAYGEASKSTCISGLAMLKVGGAVHAECMACGDKNRGIKLVVKGRRTMRDKCQAMAEKSVVPVGEPQPAEP